MFQDVFNNVPRFSVYFSRLENVSVFFQVFPHLGNCDNEYPEIESSKLTVGRRDAEESRYMDVCSSRCVRGHRSTGEQPNSEVLDVEVDEY